MIGQEDILIDITVPAATDTQTCGFQVLQYHAIIGSTFAQRPEVLREGEAVLQQFIQETILIQLQQVNRETTEQYYKEVRLKLQQPEWGVPLRTHPTWPDIQTLPRKRKPPVQSRTVNNTIWNDQIDRKEIRQMQLRGSCPHISDTVNPSPALARDMEAQKITQESTDQLQQTHRWLEESTTVDRFNSPAHTERKQISAQTAAAQRSTT